MSQQNSMNSTMQRAMELIQEPEKRIQRNLYNFVVQTKYLSESQVYAEAYLRGLVNGRQQEVISSADRKIIDEQLMTDYQRFCTSKVDLTPVIMDFRPTSSEASVIINEMFAELTRLEASGADIAALGAQIEFAINVLKRTNLSGLENVNRLMQIIEHVNEKYMELSILQNPFETNQTNIQQSESSPRQFFTPNNRTFNVINNSQSNSSSRNHHNSTSYYTTNQTPAYFGENSNTNGNYIANRQRMNGNETTNSILNGRHTSVLAGPHRVSATIINILSKNVYNVGMDAIDQIETWENQASRMEVPNDYFLSYMEVLLSQDLQSWWSLNRSRLDNWQKFKAQFLEDFD